MNKKAFTITEVFVYILALVFGAMILMYGYNSISEIVNFGEKAIFVKFQKNLENSVTEISALPGTSRIKTFATPINFEKICFFDYTKACDPDSLSESISIVDNIRQTICDSVNSKVANVFLLPLKGNDLNIPKIELTESQNPLCINIASGSLNLKITGKGKTALIEPTE
ncbi:MAG: hypothetical protein WC471_00295 [Candidatus Woesearchaeota archaeon]